MTCKTHLSNVNVEEIDTAINHSGLDFKVIIFLERAGPRIPNIEYPLPFMRLKSSTK